MIETLAICFLGLRWMTIFGIFACELRKAVRLELNSTQAFDITSTKLLFLKLLR